MGRIGKPKKRKGKKKRKARAWLERSSFLSEVKTVARKVQKRSNFVNPQLVKYRQGAISTPPTGAIVRHSGGGTEDADWVRDTLAE